MSSSTPYSRTPSVYVCPSRWQTKFHTHKTTGRITVLYALNFIRHIFVKQADRQNILHQMITSIPWLQSATYLFMNGILICWGCPRYLSCYPTSNDWFSILHCCLTIRFKSYFAPLVKLEAWMKQILLLFSCDSLFIGVLIQRVRVWMWLQTKQLHLQNIHD
jgi:hypothetical protein